ncbi:MAG: DUF1573 domain-containing protein [Lentisphaerae bacterium]|nr:DUF1573 domain-containing protein [Lentisphaerota bacterium]
MKILPLPIFLSVAFPLAGLCANELTILPESTLELGEFPAETEQIGTFTLTNTTDRTIRLKEITSCCAFISPILYEKQIAPGRSTPLDVLIDARLLEGPFTKYLTLTTDDPDNPETRLWINGTAVAALRTPNPHLFAGWIPKNEDWSTNLTIHVRSDITNQLRVSSIHGFDLEPHLEKQENNYSLHLRMPPQKLAVHWETSLQIQGGTATPPLNISIEGHVGTQLLPQTAVLGVSEKTVSFDLVRKAADLKNISTAPIKTSISGINIEERKSSALDRSTINLRLSDSLFQELREKRRIPLELTAEDCIPAVIILEYQPE